MGVGVLSSEDDLRYEELPLNVKHIQVVGYGHEVNFRRKELVVGVIPPVSCEDSKLSALYELLNLVLELPEVSGGGFGELFRVSSSSQGVWHQVCNSSVFLKEFVLECGGSHWISLQSLYRGNPV